MKYLCSCALIALISVVSGSEARSAESKPILTLYVAEIAGYMGGPPERPGILVELVKLAATEKGYIVETKLVPWARAIRVVASTKNSLIPGFSRIPEREPNYRWIIPQMQVGSAFFSLSRKINSRDEAKKLKSIGVHRATSHHVELKKLGFSNLLDVDNIKQSIKMLERGRIDAWYGDANEYFQRWLQFKGEGAEKLFIGDLLNSEHIWLAANKNLPDSVAHDIKEGMEIVIKKGLRSELIRKYFGRD